MDHSKEIIVIAGPTAVGKTKYAIEIAKAFSGEIVSADSMQLYQFMDIGSAKPTTAELAEVRHHLVDEVDPREPFSVVLYQQKAKAAIADIHRRGKLPVVSGGTGLYIHSLIHDMDFSAPPAEEGYREKLEALAREVGNAHVHSLLAEKDPAAAERIHPNNLKKIIRALEISEKGEGAVKEFSRSFKRTGDYRFTLVGLTRTRQELYQRIDDRVDVLLCRGLIREVEQLLDMGLSAGHISMMGIGYKEVIGFLTGEYDQAHAEYLIKRNSRHYAKRQLTWLARYEEMQWFDLSEYADDDEGTKEVISWLAKRK